MSKLILNTPQAPDPIGPYNQAVFGAGLLFISGQIGYNKAEDKWMTGNIQEETTMVMNNLKAILEEAGLGFGNVVKASIFVKDMGQFEQINEVYGSFFEGNYPARETVEVSGLPKNVNVEISMIAAP